MRREATHTLGGLVTTEEALRIAGRRKRMRWIGLAALSVWVLGLTLATSRLGGDNVAGFLVLLIGACLIGIFVLQRDREIQRQLKSTMIVDERGQIVDHAESVVARIAKERAAPAFAGAAVYHVVGSIGVVVFPDESDPLRITSAFLAIAAGIATYWRLRRAVLRKEAAGTLGR